MSDTEAPDLAARSTRTRQIRESAFFLPVLGTVLLVSPLLNIFASPDTVLGMPLPFLYIFGVWLFLILLARRLSRELAERPPGG